MSLLACYRALGYFEVAYAAAGCGATLLALAMGHRAKWKGIFYDVSVAVNLACRHNRLWL